MESCLQDKNEGLLVDLRIIFNDILKDQSQGGANSELLEFKVAPTNTKTLFIFDRFLKTRKRGNLFAKEAFQKQLEVCSLRGPVSRNFINGSKEFLGAEPILVTEQTLI